MGAGAAGMGAGAAGMGAGAAGAAAAPRALPHPRQNAESERVAVPQLGHRTMPRPALSVTEQSLEPGVVAGNTLNA